MTHSDKIEAAKNLIDGLSSDERVVLNMIAEEFQSSGGHGMRRSMMRGDVKVANRLVKTGLVACGHADDGRATYYLDNTYALYVLGLR